jgi:hypothetical protein
VAGAQNDAGQPPGRSEPWRYSRRGERLPDHCLDCGATMVGPFCASCGQKNEPEHRSLWQLVKDAVGPAVLLESKLWRTLGELFRHPGALSEAYTEGKRSRYIRPLRLYFWVSVLFFSALALYPTHVATLKLEPSEGVHIPFSPELNRRLEKKLEPFREGKAPEGSAEANERLRVELLSRLPKAAFLLLPFFALLLRALWWNRPYVEHLVFALHAHTVLYLGLGLVLIGWTPLRVIGLWMPVIWFFLAVRRFYGDGWALTVVKTSLLGVLDIFLLVATMMLTSLVALLGT